MSKPPSVTAVADLVDRLLQSVPLPRRRRIYAWVYRIGAVAALGGLLLPMLDVDEVAGVPLAPVIAACLLVAAVSNRLADANTKPTQEG